MRRLIARLLTVVAIAFIALPITGCPPSDDSKKGAPEAPKDAGDAAKDAGEKK
jgi:hypothetical protein